MKTVIVLLGLLCLMSPALGGGHHKEKKGDTCVLPDRFQTGITHVFYDKNTCLNTYDRGVLYMDLTNRQLRLDLMGVTSKKGGKLDEEDDTEDITDMRKVKFSVWHDLKKGRMFVYDRVKDRCKRTNIDLNIPDHLSIPANVELEGDATIGSELISFYFLDNLPKKCYKKWMKEEKKIGMDEIDEEEDEDIEAKKSEKKLSGLIGVNKNCWPVKKMIFESTKKNTKNPHLLLTEHYYNFVPEVTPFFFDIPSKCMGKKARTEDFEVPDVLEHFNPEMILHGF